MVEAVQGSTGKPVLDRPDELLKGIGAEVWQAYNAMETTKRRHFDLLEIINNKKKNYNIDPTERNTRLLACLLKDHDEQVGRFTDASRLLKERDAEAHTALFIYIGDISNASARQQATH